MFNLQLMRNIIYCIIFILRQKHNEIKVCEFIFNEVQFSNKIMF